MMEGGCFFFYDYEKKKEKLQESYVWPSMVVSLFGFKRNKDEKRNNPKKERMKAHCERFKPHFLLPGFTRELIYLNQIISY